jgi:protein-tyrosine phosphatase
VEPNSRPLLRSRELIWDGCLNVRDLGGHPTEDGGETRFGAVVRADSVRGLSDEGWEALVAYGVRRIVDLRWHEELEEDPPRDLPVDAVHVPLFGQREEMREIDELAEGNRDPVSRRATVYRQALQRFRPNFARAIAAVAHAPPGAVVVHCAGGVDRTGLVAALLLRLAGVGNRAVADDWAASERNWGPHVGIWIAEAETEDERTFRRMLARCPPEVMVDVLADLEDRHGSVAEYLQEAGIADSELEAVRSRLLG